MTKQVDKPHVSIVTPVYNTVNFLEQCIKSVLEQTWSNFEYVIVDNRSNDGSVEIALNHAEKDARIRVVVADRHRTQSENYNYALSQIADASKYCKIVQADDQIFPECIERMVGVAESDDSVGLVGCYYLVGTDEIQGVGLALDRHIFSGTEIARRQLMFGEFYLGSPTCLLYKASLVRTIAPFFDPEQLHDDTDVGYKILKDWKFGFVHQVLAFQRTEHESISTSVEGLSPHGVDKLSVILKHGESFLSTDEYDQCLRKHLRRYSRTYVRAAMGPRSKEFRQYHAAALRRIGFQIPRNVMLRAILSEVIRVIGNPLRTLKRVLVRLGFKARE